MWDNNIQHPPSNSSKEVEAWVWNVVEPVFERRYRKEIGLREDAWTTVYQAWDYNICEEKLYNWLERRKPNQRYIGFVLQHLGELCIIESWSG